jgi:hypothetical protein
MKRHLSVIVLILEITSIGLIHAIKIKQSEKTNQYNVASRISSQPPESKTKIPYYFIKMLKNSLLPDSGPQER